MNTASGASVRMPPSSASGFKAGDTFPQAFSLQCANEDSAPTTEDGVGDQGTELGGACVCAGACGEGVSYINKLSWNMFSHYAIIT